MTLSDGGNFGRHPSTSRDAAGQLLEIRMFHLDGQPVNIFVYILYYYRLRAAEVCRA